MATQSVGCIEDMLAIWPRTFVGAEGVRITFELKFVAQSNSQLLLCLEVLRDT